MFSDIVPALQAKYPVTDKKQQSIEIKSNNPIESGERVLRCKKVYLYPDAKQKEKLVSMIAGYTKVYNSALRIMKRELLLNRKLTDKKIKSQLLNEHKFRSKYKSEITQAINVKYHTLQSNLIDEAIFEVVRGYKSDFSNFRNGNTGGFRKRYRKLDKKGLTVTIPANAFTGKNTFCGSIFGNEIKNNDDFKRKWQVNTDNLKWVTSACKLQHNPGKEKAFTLFVPVGRPIYENTSDRICSLDPGVRTFQTVYDKESFYDIGSDMAKKIQKYKSLVERKQCNSAWYRKYSARLHDRIKHIRDDCHYKACKYLCSNYKTILIGNLSTKSVVRRGGNLQPGTRDTLNLLGHYQFRERLIAKGELYGTEVIIADESYTSKTCGMCGVLNEKLGGSKEFKCVCGFVCDRDFNGARNIMIKNLQ